MPLKGGDTSALRAYNERLLLQAVRQSGPLSKAELGRVTGLSAQAAADISKRLLADGLLVTQEKVRGRVGQPMTPLALNPKGAFGVGVKIGRRSVEAVLLDFTGRRLRQWRADHGAPVMANCLDNAVAGVRHVVRTVPKGERHRIAGLGLAMPSQIHLWATELGMAPAMLAAWTEADPARALALATGLDTFLYNDANAACAAELELGTGVLTANSLYVYVGAFIGGGVVTNGKLLHGDRGNAGAIGSMPVTSTGDASLPRQLIHEASLVFLERALQGAGLDPVGAMAGDAVSPAAETVFGNWADRAAPAIAHCAAAAASLLDLETVVVDGLLHPRWRADLLVRTERALAAINQTGLNPFVVVSGSLGADARVLGAALLPLHRRFSPQPERLVRSALDAAA